MTEVQLHRASLPRLVYALGVAQRRRRCRLPLPPRVRTKAIREKLAGRGLASATSACWRPTLQNFGNVLHVENNVQNVGQDGSERLRIGAV